MNTYPPSTSVRVWVKFLDSTGVLADPTTVILQVKDPSGTISTYTDPEVVKSSTGQYYYDLLANQSGIWAYKWQGTGNVEVATPDTSIFVTPSQFPAVG